jgi:glutaryl-CoA dehydrogenase
MSSDFTAYALSPEHEALRESVRQLADDKIAPYAAQVDQRSEFPQEAHDALVKADLHAVHIPEAYGGAGADALATVIVIEEVARACASSSLIPAVNKLGTVPLLLAGSPDLNQRYLPPVARGEAMFSYALSEPEAGSDAAAMRTVAVRDGNTYVLNGTKRWITNGNLAHVALVWAKLGGVDGEVRGFLVPTDTKGFEARPIHKKVSLRASVTSELILEDVRVPKDAILAGVRGMKGPLSCLTAARFGIAWGVIGSASACFDCAVDYAKHRVQFAGKPIAAHQLVQAKLAEMLTSISNMQLQVTEAARLKAAKQLQPAHVSMIKRHNARAALEIARVCRDILGGNGITLEYPVMRHMCNLETVFTYEGTHDIHTLILGQHVTGIPAYE